MKILLSKIMFYVMILTLMSCSLQLRITADKKEPQSTNEIQIIIEKIEKKTYIGWWVYGEDQHIFKDKRTLKEFKLDFPNENLEDIKKLYLAICEMEYFPMECSIKGHLKKDVLKNETTLIVSNFEILHIEGCEE